VIVSRPATLTEESLLKKEKAGKVFFSFKAQKLKKAVQIPDFLQVQIWNDRSQKPKKNYGSHPVL
jgi:hypothetical protein